MRRTAPVALALLVVVGACAWAPAAAASVQPPSVTAKRRPASLASRWVPHRVLVRWRPGISAARTEALLQTAGAERVDRVAGGRVEVLRTRASVMDTVALLSRDPAVVTAQPDYLLFPTATPNDPRLPDQWNLLNTGQPHPVTRSPLLAAGREDADVDAEAAWGPTGSGPVLAILDSGVDVTHPDLNASLWNNPGEVPANGVDDDENGLIDDVHGWDFARDRARLFEPGGLPGYDHGTHVAGIAAAETDNGVGIAGVCPSCRIMVLKFMRPTDIDDDGDADVMAGRTSAELDALAYAMAEGAHIVNGSFGSPAWSPLERGAFRRLGAAGTLAVLAAGNSNGDNDMYLFADFDGNGSPDSVSPSYPASYDLDTIVSVAASNHWDRYGYETVCALQIGARWPCTFTSWGRVSVDLAAPGVDVLSTVAAPAYEVFDGTSMSSPHVAAAAALLAGLHPAWSPVEIRNAITDTVDRPPTLETLRAIPGRLVTSGGLTATNGRLNVAQALAATDPADTAPRPDGTVRGAKGIRALRGGRLAWPRDTNDVFRKRLKRGRRYKVALGGPRGADFDLIVYKPGTKEVWQIEPSCARRGGDCSLVSFRAGPDADESAHFRARSSGKYVFQVSSFFSEGRYRLRVKRL